MLWRDGGGWGGGILEEKGCDGVIAVIEAGWVEIQWI